MHKKIYIYSIFIDKDGNCIVCWIALKEVPLKQRGRQSVTV